MIAPAKTPGMKELQQERDGEIGALKERLNTLTETIQQDPAAWIGKHPYLATGGAAAAGFLIAQLTGKSRQAAPPTPRPIPLQHQRSPDISDRLFDLAAIFAEKYLAQTASESNLEGEEVVGTVTIADTGSATGPHFPGDFSEAPPAR